MLKRITSLILALLMLALCFSCGSGEQSGDDTTPTQTSTSPSEDDVTLKSGVPEGTTFNNTTVRILNGAYYEKYFYMLNATEINGEVVNDAVYNRNRAVENKLGVTLDITDIYEHNPEWNGLASLRKAVTAGDQEYDIYQTITSVAYQIPNEGLAYDMQDSEYITFDAPWWSNKWIESAHLGSNKRYLVTGDISPAHTMQMCVVFYNKALIEDYYGDGDMLYKEVLDGKWTLDRLYELSKGIWEDEDGSENVSGGDTVGIAGASKTVHFHHLFYNAGGTTTYYDDKGELQIKPLGDLEFGILEKMYKLVWNNPGFWNISVDKVNSETELPVKFAEGNIAFMYNYLFTADLMRDMEDKYGIIPCPKGDESVEGYTTLIHNQSPVYCIPSVTSTADVSCAVLEEMAYQGYNDVIPKYYEVALKSKYMRDTQDEAMQIIDLIRAGAMTEAAFNLAIKVRDVAYATIGDMNNNFASWYTSQFDASVEKLEDYKKFFAD